MPDQSDQLTRLKAALAVLGSPPASWPSDSVIQRSRAAKRERALQKPGP